MSTLSCAVDIVGICKLNPVNACFAHDLLYNLVAKVGPNVLNVGEMLCFN